MPNAVQSEIYVGNLMDISMTNPDFLLLNLVIKFWEEELLEDYLRI